MIETGILEQPKCFVLTFTDENKEIGSLRIKDGQLTFEGDADRSAQIFFDEIIKKYSQELRALKKGGDTMRK